MATPFRAALAKLVATPDDELSALAQSSAPIDRGDVAAAIEGMLADTSSTRAIARLEGLLGRKFASHVADRFADPKIKRDGCTYRYVSGCGYILTGNADHKLVKVSNSQITAIGSITLRSLEFAEGKLTCTQVMTPNGIPNTTTVHLVSLEPHRDIPCWYVERIVIATDTSSSSVVYHHLAESYRKMTVGNLTTTHYASHIGAECTVQLHEHVRCHTEYGKTSYNTYMPDMYNYVHYPGRSLTITGDIYEFRISGLPAYRFRFTAGPGIGQDSLTLIETLPASGPAGRTTWALHPDANH